MTFRQQQQYHFNSNNNRNERRKNRFEEKKFGRKKRKKLKTVTQWCDGRCDVFNVNFCGHMHHTAQRKYTRFWILRQTLTAIREERLHSAFFFVNKILLHRVCVKVRENRNAYVNDVKRRTNYMHWAFYVCFFLSSFALKLGKPTFMGNVHFQTSKIRKESKVDELCASIYSLFIVEFSGDMAGT